MSIPFALTRLWTHAQSALAALCAKLLPLDTLTNGERRKLRAWLRALEAFCRRLALTEALALPSNVSRAHPRTPSTWVTNAQRRPALRLWPKAKRPAPRIRLLGAATSVRELQDAQRRAALIARLAAGRARRKAAHVRLADRIEALQRFLDAPSGAARRFARKLRQTPRIALLVIARRAPASPFLAAEQVSECERLCYAAVRNSS